MNRDNAKLTITHRKRQLSDISYRAEEIQRYGRIIGLVIRDHLQDLGPHADAGIANIQRILQEIDMLATRIQIDAGNID
jgi:hypothetical protein